MNNSSNNDLRCRKRREVEAIETLVETNGNSSILSARDEWGYTPAHWAALDGNLEVRLKFRASMNLAINRCKLLPNIWFPSFVGNALSRREERTCRSLLFRDSGTETDTLGLP